MGVVNRSPGTTDGYHDQNISRGGHIVNNPLSMAVGLADSGCPRMTCPVTCSRQPVAESADDVHRVRNNLRLVI